jgi:hypothetical protein
MIIYKQSNNNKENLKENIFPIQLQNDDKMGKPGTEHSLNDTMENIQLEDIEKIIDDLLQDKITLNQIPLKIQKYSEEIKKLPPFPSKPNNEDCCGSGCSPCIWDIYDMNEESYRDALAKLSQKIIKEGTFKNNM